MFKNGFIVLLFASIVFAANAYSKDCDRYKTQIKHLEDLRRHGGKIAKMNRWRRQSHSLEDTLSRCKNRAGVDKPIQIVAGKKVTTKNQYKQDQYKQHRYKQHQIKTLKIARNENENFSEKMSSPNVIHVRKLRECIKPNKLIDNDVNECLKGNLDASWNK
jgi:hypothetical protein